MIFCSRVSVVVGDVTLLPPTDCEVGKAEALIVRGPNGSGKSTLLGLLADAQSPTSGTVRVNGRPVNRLDRHYRRTVAAMLAVPPTSPTLTLHDHLMLVASSWPGLDAAAISGGLLEEFDLVHLARRFPHELSSGQAQTFALALTLARPFDVLLLDEPEQRLDEGRLDMVVGALARRRDHGATMVIATHSDRLQRELGDRVLRLASP